MGGGGGEGIWLGELGAGVGVFIIWGFGGCGGGLGSFLGSGLRGS